MNGNLHGTRRRNLVIRLHYVEQHSHGKTERTECWQTALTLTDDEETENQTHGSKIDLLDQAMQISATLCLGSRTVDASFPPFSLLSLFVNKELKRSEEANKIR